MLGLCRNKLSVKTTTCNEVKQKRSYLGGCKGKPATFGNHSHCAIEYKGKQKKEDSNTATTVVNTPQSEEDDSDVEKMMKKYHTKKTDDLQNVNSVKNNLGFSFNTNPVELHTNKPSDDSTDNDCNGMEDYEDIYLYLEEYLFCPI